jgi:hypothetical protein
MSSGKQKRSDSDTDTVPRDAQRGRAGPLLIDLRGARDVLGEVGEK